MAQLDRLGWADGMAFVSYGVRIGVRVSDPALLSQLQPALPPDRRSASSAVVERLYSVVAGGSGPRPGVRRFNLVYGDTDLVARTRELDEALERLDSNLRFYIAEHARRRIFVHAGVVGWRGQAIVIPGRASTGKSTLVAALVRAGATHYCDEYAVFDGRGRVHPYPRPLSLHDDGEGLPRKYSPESLGGVCGVEPLPVGMVLISPYRPGATWRPRALSPGQGTLALLAHTMPARLRPRAALSTLRHVAAAARILRGVRGEAGEVARSILEEVAR